MDLSKLTGGGTFLSEEDCRKITANLCEVNALLLAIHTQGESIINDSGDDIDTVANMAIAIRTMAMFGSHRLDAVARALGDPGYGAFDEEFAPIVLGNVAQVEE